MPRKARDERLDTRTARLRLAPRAEPYWRTVQEGRALGYRRAAGGKAGTWIARLYDRSEGRQYQALGSADDMLDADGATTLSFAQAQDKAVAWFPQMNRTGGRVIEPSTVRAALDDYMADFLARGGKSEADTRRAINAHILPALGDLLVTDLTTEALNKWLRRLATSPARLRTSEKATKANVRKAEDTDAKRARRSTANRVLSILKAALSLVYREGKAPSDNAWRRVKPFKDADAPRVRYLDDDAARRLVNACPADLRRIVTAGLLTGARYGELTKLQTRDFDAAGALLHIREAKAGKPRTIHLTDDAVRFFTAETAGKSRTALILTRADGGAWGKSHQHRPLRDACAAASIAPAISFHILRHTFASRLLMKGVPMAVVAAALGNTEVVCARHYAHLAPDYVAKAIRQHAGGLNIVPEQSAVVPMRRS